MESENGHIMDLCKSNAGIGGLFIERIEFKLDSFKTDKIRIKRDA